MNNERPHRGTIKLEDCEVLSCEAHPGEQYVMRLRAPDIAATAVPGSFVHLSCDAALPMRRPMSVMRTSPQGTFDVLFKAVGTGTQALASRQPGDKLSGLGPIGQGFTPDPKRPKALLLGGGVGIPPMVFLAETLAAAGTPPALVVMGSEVPFPFTPGRTSEPVPGMPAHVDATMPAVADFGIATRLASTQGFAGCFNGYVTNAANAWLNGLDADERSQVAVYACGPNPMLAAVAALARSFQLPCQVSLEEFMACAVGGCAGCAVRIHTSRGAQMKRVCVDGPVFDGADVDWETLARLA